jgi:hypothetical protein
VLDLGLTGSDKSCGAAWALADLIRSTVQTRYDSDKMLKHYTANVRASPQKEYCSRSGSQCVRASPPKKKLQQERESVLVGRSPSTVPVARQGGTKQPWPLRASPQKEYCSRSGSQCVRASPPKQKLQQERESVLVGRSPSTVPVARQGRTC